MEWDIGEHGLAAIVEEAIAATHGLYRGAADRAKPRPRLRKCRGSAATRTG